MDGSDLRNLHVTHTRTRKDFYRKEGRKRRYTPFAGRTPLGKAIYPFCRKDAPGKRDIPLLQEGTGADFIARKRGYTPLPRTQPRHSRDSRVLPWTIPPSRITIPFSFVFGGTTRITGKPAPTFTSFVFWGGGHAPHLNLQLKPRPTPDVDTRSVGWGTGNEWEMTADLRPLGVDLRADLHPVRVLTHVRDKVA